MIEPNVSLLFSQHDLKLWFDPTTLARGKAYHQEGRVTQLQWDGTLLSAEVRGSQPTPYKVTIEFVDDEFYEEYEDWDENGDDIQTTCTCPIGGGCKHVAATLYTTLARPPHFTRASIPPAGASPAPVDPAILATLRSRLNALERADLLTLLQTLLTTTPTAAPQLSTQLELTTTTDPDTLHTLLHPHIAALYVNLQDPTARHALDTLCARATEAQTNGQLETAAQIARVLLTEISSGALTHPLGPPRYINGMYEPPTKPVFPQHAQALQLLLSLWPQLPATSHARHVALRTLFDVLSYYHFTEAQPKLINTLIQALAAQSTPDERDCLHAWAIQASLSSAPPHPYNPYDYLAGTQPITQLWTKLIQAVTTPSPA